MIEIGNRYGRLTVLSRAPKNPSLASKSKLFNCKCDCGNEKIISSNSLHVGTKSCGCLQKEIARTRFYTHGLTHTELYKRWKSMMERCYMPTKRKYADYGGRGITVCKRWHNPTTFYKDNEHAYKPELELDRINNSKGYSPKNCRWTTRKEQCRNTRRNRFLVVDGQRKCIAEWSEITGISSVTISSRLRLGWNEKEAVTKPLCY